MSKEVKIGIIGFGTVGSGVVACLLENAEVISRRTGIKPVVTRIADIDIEKDRGIQVPREILVNDPSAVIDTSDVIVELVGGTTFAKDIILKALSKGKPVVTANKALLAEYGEEIFAAAEKSKADIYYEASVAGGIPIIKALREGFVANKIQSIHAILNGTCNYILTKMENENRNFNSALSEAKKMGYAEANPTLDIDGTDTVHKTAILASLAYGEWFGIKPIYKEGVDKISIDDIRFASTLGYKLKLLAIIKQQNEDVQVRVHPALIRKNTMLANVSDVFNGVRIKGNPVGETLFYGRGAGRDATASAVVADIVDVCLNLKFGSHRRVPSFRIGRQFRHIIPMEDIITRYYLRVNVFDKPGVIASVSSVLGTKSISISSIFQTEENQSNVTSLVILTHKAKEKLIREAVTEIEKFSFVRQKLTLIRIEDLE
ncbi:MAG TPA: homoserine dehydrogenase [Victivallales bacterium]|nr:homoserine dehydrogenase [Victivallales bacterium]HRR06420.1 homoserine dehydrogenase [Victivallales bacterium]